MTQPMLKDRMIRLQRRPDRQPFIAGCRLDPGLLKRSFREELAVGDAIERAASRHGQL